MSTEEERRRAAEINARTKADLLHRGVRTARDQWLLGEVSRGDKGIGPIQPAQIPPHFAKTSSGPTQARLRRLLPEIDAWAGELVGLDMVEADALYNGDPLAMVLRDEVTAWGLDYARERLGRPSAKDQGDPFRRWLRLEQEVVNLMERICLRPGVGVALSEVPDRVAHLVWTATVGAHLTITRDGGGMWLSFGALDPQCWEAVREIALLYCWNEADALPRAREQFRQRREGEPEALRRHRAALAEDLVEARALLIGSHDPAATIVSVPGGAATFMWVFHHAAGLLLSGATRAAVEKQTTSGFVHGPLRIHLDGRLTGHVSWWEESADPGWEVALLEAVHAPIVEAWLARVPAPAPEGEPSTEAQAVATVADANQRIAEVVDGRRLPAVRMETLLRQLERRFGCDVAAGKGSEVTVYRPGGRKFTLGRHARNRHVPAHLVRALLRAVGIPVTEWWSNVDA
ncbi:MAG: hypothetical protein Q8P18_19820 [Pseudomonadota bacterium]|nr:hypothetical protein [Pseudomonadota bacterium]